MCGIAGFFDPERGAEQETARAMAAAVSHRGPDHLGAWAQGHVGLGHSRLAVIDLSPAARQPMTDDALVLACNGEIYNYRELRACLPDYPFRSESDTEVLLAALREWGVRDTLRRVNGMFAFAAWDRRAGTLTLARDRMGIKPLYYGRCGKTFLFGSELKALRAHPGWDGEIDRDALALFFRHGYVPAPYSIFRGVRKLQPGSFLVLDAASGRVEEDVYWSALQVVRGADPLRGTVAEAAEELEQVLATAVRERLVADVPLGAFLSGGIDSTLVTALMARHGGGRVRTFTVGFENTIYDEAPFARAVAAHLGTEHTEVTLTPAEALAVVPRLPRMYDEPFADSSQIPTHLLSAVTREHVTVALSGDGGDEIFGGYRRYLYGRKLWRVVGWMPYGLRALLAAGGGLLAGHGPRALKAWCERFIPAPREQRIPGDGIRYVAKMLSAQDDTGFYAAITSRQVDPLRLVPGAEPLATALTAMRYLPRNLSFLRRMMLADALAYLPGDILAKVDRASMAVALEVRVPLLDHRVFEFAARLPDAMLMRGDAGKWLLRQVLYRHVPPRLVERPKRGFAVPVGAWLRGELREWASDLLGEESPRARGLLDAGLVRELWRQHQAGERDWQHELWNLLMFQAWLREWG